MSSVQQAPIYNLENYGPLREKQLTFHIPRIHNNMEEKDIRTTVFHWCRDMVKPMRAHRAVALSQDDVSIRVDLVDLEGNISFQQAFVYVTFNDAWSDVPFVMTNKIAEAENTARPIRIYLRDKERNKKVYWLVLHNKFPLSYSSKLVADELHEIGIDIHDQLMDLMMNGIMVPHNFDKSVIEKPDLIGPHIYGSEQRRLLQQRLSACDRALNILQHAAERSNTPTVHDQDTIIAEYEKELDDEIAIFQEMNMMMEADLEMIEQSANEDYDQYDRAHQ